MESQPWLKFIVYGKPQPRGSKNSFPLTNRATGQPVRGKGGRIVTITTDSNPKSGAYMQAVASCARSAMQEAGISGLILAPCELRITFIVSRPAGDFRKNGEVKPGARAYPSVKPDALKLARGLEDALTKTVWKDDAQVVRLIVDKVYGDVPGAEVEIRQLDATVAEYMSDGAAMPDRNGLGTDSTEESKHAA